MKKLLKACLYPGCPAIVESGYCENHKPPPSPSEINRPNANQRGYNYKWQKASRQYLKENPFCVECIKEGIPHPSECTDHIVPHKGNMDLFWDKENWQALCFRHHNIKTAKEDGGFGKLN